MPCGIPMLISNSSLSVRISAETTAVSQGWEQMHLEREGTKLASWSRSSEAKQMTFSP